jgi:putative transposase
LPPHWRDHKRQQRIIEFQNDQIKALLNWLGKRRLPLSDDQRQVLTTRRLADYYIGAL